MLTVVVQFDEDRGVLINGEYAGRTNKPIMVGAGTCVFELNGREDYVPKRLTVDLKYTSQTKPKEISFKRS